MNPPNPGKGYRLLKVGEIRKEGDQYIIANWEDTVGVGCKYAKQTRDQGFFYRRKLKPKAKHGPAKSKV